MYNTDIDRRPRQAVVKSSLSAKNDFILWVKQNNLYEMVDKDGDVWQVQLKARQIPDLLNVHGLIWQMDVIWLSRLRCAGLVTAGILDSVQDARLLSLIADEEIPMTMGPRNVSGHSEMVLTQGLNSLLVDVKQQLETIDLSQIKRKAVVRWVDLRRSFFRER
jgi:hypothetical protein